MPQIFHKEILNLIHVLYPNWVVKPKFPRDTIHLFDDWIQAFTNVQHNVNKCLHLNCSYSDTVEKLDYSIHLD